MDRTYDNTAPAPTLLSLAGHQGEELGTTLLRLAHLAAAHHRAAAVTQHQHEQAASARPIARVLHFQGREATR